MVPMLTRTERRQSGLQHPGVTRTASILSAAAERKMAPTFVDSVTSSKIAIRLLSLQIDCTEGSVGRYIAQSTPRVKRNPVKFCKMVLSAVYTGIDGHRSIIACASPSICLDR